jgi:hypothetical protein
MADTMIVEGDDTIKETGTEMRRQEDRVRTLAQPVALKRDASATGTLHSQSPLLTLPGFAGHVHTEGPPSLASR